MSFGEHPVSFNGQASHLQASGIGEKRLGEGNGHESIREIVGEEEESGERKPKSNLTKILEGSN